MDIGADVPQSVTVSAKSRLMGAVSTISDGSDVFLDFALC